VRFRVALPETLAADREPLLASGTVEAHDILWLRAAGAGRWTLALGTAAGAETVSPPFELAPGGFHAFEVELDRTASRVTLRIDGTERAALSGALVPVRAATITLGRGPRGKGALDRGHFSGTILSQGLLWAAPPGLESLPPISLGLDSEAEEPPALPGLGQVWIPPGKDGAYLFDGKEWRWIPRYRAEGTPRT
jgi:hypothetical protein